MEELSVIEPVSKTDTLTLLREHFRVTDLTSKFNCSLGNQSFRCFQNVELKLITKIPIAWKETSCLIFVPLLQKYLLPLLTMQL